MKTVALSLALCLLLPACHRNDPQAAAQAAAAQQAADEQAAEAMEKQFDAAVVAQDWHLAKGYGDVLLHDHPASAAAARAITSPSNFGGVSGAVFAVLRADFFAAAFLAMMNRLDQNDLTTDGPR